MLSVSQIINTTSTIETEKLLDKKISVRNVLSLIDGNSYFNEQDFLRKIKELSIPYQKLTEYDTYTRVKPLPNKNDSYPEVAFVFQKYYSDRGYAASTLEIHMRNLRLFIKFLANWFIHEAPFVTMDDMRSLTKTMVIAYEEYLVDRLNIEQIQRSSVYKYLVTVRLFLKMLSSQSVVTISYVIPEALRDQGKRSNDYIEVEQIKALIDTVVMSKSLLKMRDMSVILLVMELGCRPIEVTNLKLSDLRTTERKITLYCEKSDFRELNISKDLCDVLKKYLEIRSTLKITHQYLFVNAFGERLTRTGVASIFQRTNKKAFGENRFNAKALRHTYATNALDNENDFDEVSASMGHIHRCSTEWYIHRSVQRMLKRTLPHNPLNRIQSEE
jgi:integrase/recombinase XerC